MLLALRHDKFTDDEGRTRQAMVNQTFITDSNKTVTNWGRCLFL